MDDGRQKKIYESFVAVLDLCSRYIILITTVYLKFSSLECFSVYI